LFLAWSQQSQDILHRGSTPATSTQIEDQRLSEVVHSGAYLEATKEVLQKHGGLWFTDESYVISRKRDSV